MNIKNILSVIFICLILFNCACSSDSPSLRDDIPVFKCIIEAYTCYFTSVVLNSTHYFWEPTADNPLLVGGVNFCSSVIPVITNGICNTFPTLQFLYMTHLGVKEIAEDAFQNCSALTNLYLNSNQIKKLQPNTFMYLKNLLNLQLYDNQIMELNDYDLFADLQKLAALALYQNNLTEFSAELLRNNKKLYNLRLDSNYLSDLEVEQLVKFVPNFQKLYWGDNEVSCSRVVEANNLLTSKGIDFNDAASSRVRYYPTEKVFGTIRCNPDISWMASNYRKENSKMSQQIERIDGKILKMD